MCRACGKSLWLAGETRKRLKKYCSRKECRGSRNLTGARGKIALSIPPLDPIREFMCPGPRCRGKKLYRGPNRFMCPVCLREASNGEAYFAGHRVGGRRG